MDVARLHYRGMENTEERERRLQRRRELRQLIGYLVSWQKLGRGGWSVAENCDGLKWQKLGRGDWSVSENSEGVA